MIRFNRNDSLINTDLLPPAGGFNFTFKVSSFLIISNISFQRFMFQISKHYLCIRNCRLTFYVPLSGIKECVNISKCLFRCIAKIRFVDNDFICLVIAQMQEFDSKDDAHLEKMA